MFTGIAGTTIQTLRPGQRSTARSRKLDRVSQRKINVSFLVIANNTLINFLLYMSTQFKFVSKYDEKSNSQSNAQTSFQR